ncbi:MAG: CPBP family intramembrane metalloprotease [Phycisphaerae bacterium]|nr:CPBP family intramembrane metalloprotease [Phycisphaerae bacterium]
MERPQRYACEDQGYRWQTHRPLNCLVFILPLLAAFHAGVASFGTDLMVPHYFHVVLRYFGATGVHLPAALIAAVLVGQHLLRREKWRVEMRVLAGMFVESILWSLPLIALSFLLPRTPGELTTTAPGARGLLEQLTAAVGAGIYEEFFFRLVLITSAMLIFVNVFALRKAVVASAAVIVTAIAFSLCHLPAEQLTGQVSLNWNKCIFLFGAGLLWGVVFVFRGLGIAVGSHIFYNLYVLGVAQ